MSFTRRDGTTFVVGDHVTFWDRQRRKTASGVCGSVGPILFVRGQFGGLKPYYWEVEARRAEHSSAVDQLAELADD